MSSESSNPAEVNLDRRRGQASTPPVGDDGTFATIARSRSHGFLDAVQIESFEKLSGHKYYGIPELHGLGEIPLDNGGLQIMRLIWSTA